MGMVMGIVMEMAAMATAVMAMAMALALAPENDDIRAEDADGGGVTPHRRRRPGA